MAYKFTGIELLEYGTGVLLDPRFCDRLATDEYNNALLTGLLHCAYDALDQLPLGTNESQVTQVNMLSGRCICPRRPEQRLVQRPSAYKYHCDVRVRCSRDSRIDIGCISRPKFSTFREGNVHRGCVRLDEFLNAIERADTIQ